MKSGVTQSKSTLFTAWIFLLLASGFPKIILQEIFNVQLSLNLEILIAGTVAIIGYILTLGWNEVRALRPFFVVLLALIVAQWFISTQVGGLALYQSWLNNPSFNVYMLAEQSLRLFVTCAIIGVLLVLGKRWHDFFMAKGDLNAHVSPVAWLGIKNQSWRTLGRNFTIIMSFVTLVFLLLAGTPSPQVAVRVLPFLPAIFLAAALNALNEEISYKASFLSTLEDVVGKEHAVWLMAAYFGSAHFYGVPYGLVGILLAGFLGWIAGKSMVETRGLGWAWFIHFCQDVFIFSFLAADVITPGGK